VARVVVLLRALKLPGFVAHWSDLAIEAERAGSSFGRYLHQLAEFELRERRVRDALKQSKLPLEKTLGSLKIDRLPAAVRRTLPRLCAGDFVERGDNVLVFGLPGRGKSHVTCAIGHELVRNVRRVLAVGREAVSLEDRLNTLLANSGQVSMGQITAAVRVPRTTAWRALSALVVAGLVCTEGTGKGRRYRVASPRDAAEVAPVEAVLELARGEGRVTRQRIVRALMVSERIAGRMLADLVARQRLAQVGRGRGAAYVVAAPEPAP